MASTFTPNIQLEEPARNDAVGVWDTPVNSNMTLLDLVAGAIATISLNNSPVVLSAAQFKSKTISFNSTLTGNVTITFPTSFSKSYEIFNFCTGSSAFVITLATTAAGGQVICVPPGEGIDIINDTVNMRYRNFGRVGGYWDYAGSSVPAWVSGCSVPPYLNCDGTVFSSAAFPQLAVILGGTTLPDSKGRSRFATDQGAGRISSAATAFSGSSVGSGGGSQTTTLGTSNLPPYTPGGAITFNQPTLISPGGANSLAGGTAAPQGVTQNLVGTFTGTAQGGVSAPLTNLPPAYIGGLTLIRSA